ncbi:hypothetical protein [Shinella sp.]|uniref:hypothetical protein n=1 Tax=Shinella sp. TaxID=1870904 RepID=UPI0039E71799
MVAVAVAILLALQALLGSAALAAHSAMPALDSFGNPLCVTGAEGHAPEPGQDRDRSPLPDCCTIACTMALGFVPTDRAAAIFFNPLVQPSQRIVARKVLHLRSMLDRLPGNPRAPPLAA